MAKQSPRSVDGHQGMQMSPEHPGYGHSVVPREGYGWTRWATCLNIMRSVDGADCAQKGTRKSGVQIVVFCCVSTRLTTASCCTTPNENCPLLSLVISLVKQAALTLSVVVGT